MRYLEENDRGFDVKVAKVPIVPAAILFDLGIGDPSARPDAQMGYKACKEAVSGSFKRGNAGAGTGATVGKILGMGQAMKGGLGTACVHMAGGIKVGALVAVNAFGDVVDPSTGAIVAGARNSDDTGFADTAAILRDGRAGAIFELTSTVIGIVATNARLTKEETNKLAQMAANGIARTILPAHTSYDGDVVFALSRADSASTTNVSAIGSAAAEALADAILDAITCAESVEGIPAAHDVKF
jgi:L-aminopeptidase/D-esterase-like protein